MDGWMVGWIGLDWVGLVYWMVGWFIGWLDGLLDGWMVSGLVVSIGLD